MERLSRLAAEGLPNRYGDQRFGVRADNTARGLAILRGQERERDHRRRRLLLSALQSAVFNQVLEIRAQAGQLRQVLTGDVLQKCESGGVFITEDPQADQRRLDAGEVVVTGPMPGGWAREPPADSEARAIEEQALAVVGAAREEFAAAGRDATGHTPPPAGPGDPGASRRRTGDRGCPRRPPEVSASRRDLRHGAAPGARGHHRRAAWPDASSPIQHWPRPGRWVTMAPMRMAERLLGLTLMGAEWVFWILIALSVISVAVMVERAIRMSGSGLKAIDLKAWGKDLFDQLSDGDIVRARRTLTRAAQSRVGGGAGGDRPLPARARGGLGRHGRRQGAPADGPGAQPGDPGHAGQQRALHRAVRHRAGDHQGVRRPGAQPEWRHHGGDDRDRGGAGGHGAGLAGGDPRRHRLQLFSGANPPDHGAGRFRGEPGAGGDVPARGGDRGAHTAHPARLNLDGRTRRGSARATTSSGRRPSRASTSRRWSTSPWCC